MNTVGAILFGLVAVVCLGLGLGSYLPLFSKDYQGDQRERFRDNLLSSLLVCVGVSCLAFAWVPGSRSDSLRSVVSVLPYLLGLGIVFLPIGILGASWASHGSRVYGKLMPVTGQRASPHSECQHIQSTDFPVSRRAILIAAVCAVPTSVGVVFGLPLFLEWGGSKLAGFLLRVVFSIGAGLGAFMRVLAVPLSRSIQRGKCNRGNRSAESPLKGR